MNFAGLPQENQTTVGSAHQYAPVYAGSKATVPKGNIVQPLNLKCYMCLPPRIKNISAILCNAEIEKRFLPIRMYVYVFQKRIFTIPFNKRPSETSCHRFMKIILDFERSI